jgi:hypothetical protein
MRYDRNRSTFQNVLIGFCWLAPGLLVAALLVYVFWNLAMPDMSGAAGMDFLHALGLVLIAGSASWLLGLSRYWKHPRIPRREDHEPGKERTG